MSRAACIVVGFLALTGCDQRASKRREVLADVASARSVDASRPSPTKSPAVSSAEIPLTNPTQELPRGSSLPEPRVAETLEGNFRGKGLPSRVLVLDNSHIVHEWVENGTELREPVTTAYPPGHRECKALRSGQSQSFLLCLYWFTGPGGGRVDGVVFDLKRRILGEFFSAALNTQLLSTFCFPKTMIGAMPSFELVDWSTKAATADSVAEVLVTVHGEGWSAKQAESLRGLPVSNEYCKCAETSEHCTGAPTPPVSTQTIVYQLEKDLLRPTAESRSVLGEIAGQWGQSAFLKAWNLTMRGY